MSAATNGGDGESARAAPGDRPDRLGLRGSLLLYAALQGGGALALLGGLALLAGLRPLLGGDSFLGRWGASFVVVPVTFVPALVAWHGWALRRFGRRPRLFRLIAEVAFAAELIGCVLWQGLA